MHNGVSQPRARLSVSVLELTSTNLGRGQEREHKGLDRPAVLHTQHLARAKCHHLAVGLNKQAYGTSSL